MRKSLMLTAALAALAMSAAPAIAEPFPSIPTRPRRQAQPWIPKRKSAQDREIAEWNAKVEAKRKARKGVRA